MANLRDAIYTVNQSLSNLFTTADGQVGADNAVRLMDAFIDKLDLQKLGFANTVHKSEGRPPFRPAVLLKLHLYSYLNKIRSSRKLEKECGRNIELQWLLQGLVPNYHTIADFRKVHAVPLRSMFRLYVQFLADAGLLGKTTIGIDGSKFRAVNSKRNNFNQNRLLNKDIKVQVNKQKPSSVCPAQMKHNSDKMTIAPMSCQPCSKPNVSGSLLLLVFCLNCFVGSLRFL